jgi:predicted N-formylglutamate amidohydrolase
MGITYLAAPGLTQSNDGNSSPAATVLDIGRGPILLICDHASNHVPAHLNDLGLNEPYAPTDGVYYTIERHATADTMLNVLIEVRNDLLRTAQDIEMWAQQLARWIRDALAILWADDTETTGDMSLLTH